MAKQVPLDEWLGPNLNYGCVVKFDEAGNVLELYWDPTGASHASVTSIREHKGYLYLGGLAKQSDRTHSHRRRRPDLDRLRGLLGRQATGMTRMSFLTHLRRDLEQILFKDRDPHAIPSMDGAFSPNDRLDRATPIGEPLAGRTRSPRRPTAPICVSAGNKIWRLSGAGYQDRASLAEFDSNVGALAFDRDGRLLGLHRARARGAGRRRPRRSISLRRSRASRCDCLTAVAAASDGTIFISDGSITPLRGGLARRSDGGHQARPHRRLRTGVRRCPRAAARSELSGWIGGSRRPPLVHRELCASYEPCADRRTRHHRRVRDRHPQHARLSVEARSRRATAASGSVSLRCARIWSNLSCAKTISATR